MIKRLWKVLWILPCVVLLFFALYWFANFLTGNFHTVLPGQLYRSAELAPRDLAQAITQYHLRTIINLRGARPERAWYRGERRVAAAYGVAHFDVDLHAHRLPSSMQLQQLTQLLQHAPKPILVHCWRGADRTGLASAIGVMVLADNPARAMRQVTWYYNVLSPTSVGYQVLRNYSTWLAQQHQVYGKASYLQWLLAKTPMRSYWGFYF